MSQFTMPKYHPTGLSNIRTYLTQQHLLRSLERDEKLPVISSSCPSLDWVTDCGGIPRGRVVVVVGPESSGKCVDLNTYIPVYGRGLVKMQELASELSWKTVNGEVVADQHVEMDLYVPDAESQPVQANAVYFAGTLESHRLITEDGNELIAARTHRVLSLSPRGILSWVMLRDLRLGDVLVKTIGQRVTGPADKIFQWDLPRDDEELTLEKCSTASFFGALCGIESRDGRIYLLVTNPSQIKMIRQWAKEMTGDLLADPFDEDVAEFSRFSGLARIRDGRWSELALKAVSAVPAIIRTASLTAQSHWCAGLTLSRGVWTQNDLELEIESEDVARTLHMLLENLGIRAIIYPSLDTFSRERSKIALRDRLAQQEAEHSIWRGYHFSPDWKGESVIDKVETHEYLHHTLERARDMLRDEGLEDDANSVDVEDLEKENLLSVSELIFPLSRKKKSFDRVYQTLHLISSSYTCLDRITFSRATGVESPMADLSVPIGALYSTAGLISHNSTLALYLSNQELTNNPNSVVVFQDYEQSTAVNYARKMGLHRHGDRFLLIPSNEFEEADSLVKIFKEQKVFPSLWIVDSIPAMVPKAMFEREVDENPQVALQARMLSDLLARWVKFAARYGVTFLLLNQIRDFISKGKFDTKAQSPGIAGSDKETYPGGRAVRFYSSMTLDLRPSKIIKANVFNPMLGEKEEIPIANMVKMTVRKNKCGAPYRSAMAYIQFGEGIDTTRTVLDLAINQKLVTVKNKSTYEVILPSSEIISVTGKEKFIQALKGQTHGNLGIMALEYLQKALQWDKADEIHSQILGLTEETVDSGEVSEVSGEEAAVVSEGLLELILSRESLVEQADALNMLTRKSKTIYWTNPDTGMVYRGQRLDLLESKLGDEGYAALERLVLERIHAIEDELNRQEGAQTVSAEPPPADGNGVAAGSLDVPPEVAEGEAWEELPAVPEGPLVDPDASERDEVSSLFNDGEDGETGNGDEMS